MAGKNQKLIRELSEFISERRRDLFLQVLERRTRYITVVLEDIYQSHNASAVIRSCECFGIQNVHIVENRNEYRINPDVVLGANKWLDLKRYREKEFNTPEALEKLRKEGYRIVATTTREGSTALEEFELNKGRLALFFGTELTGLSREVLDEADESIRIPMYGFTDSFNLSVSAAVILHHLILRLHASNLEWKLNETEKEELMIHWLRKSIKHLRGKYSDPASGRD